MSDTLSGRVTLRVSTDHIAALDGLVAAGRYPNRSAALRRAVEALLTREARLIVKNGCEPTRRHLPDGEGASVCGLGDDTELTRLSSGRGETVKLCRGCDTTTNDRRAGGGADPTGAPTEVSTHGHE